MTHIALRSLAVQIRLLPLCLALLQFSPTLLATDTKAEESLLTVDLIFGKEDEFKLQDWGPARWLKEGSGYTTLETSDFKKGKDIVLNDPATGRKQILVCASNLVPRGASEPLQISSYELSTDLTKALLFTNTRRVWRSETRGDYWIYDRNRRKLQKLGGKAEPSTLMFATLSPEGHRVAYVHRNNLFVQSLKTLRITQLTTDGSDTIINGTSDWVYEEEFGLRHGFRWSPDGKHLAYWQFDASGVGEFTLIDNTGSTYPRVTALAYPKAGGTNSACRVGVVRSTGGRTRWFRPSTDPRNHYIPELAWMEDSRDVVFQHMNRLQNTNDLIKASLRGHLARLYSDRDDAWVDAGEGWTWLEGGKRFLWLSEQDGWRHIYAVDSANGRATLLTPGSFDAMQIAGVDETEGCVYFIASPDNATQRYLFRAALDGSGGVRRVTPEGQAGWHSYDLHKDGRWAFHTYSRFGEPPVTELLELPEHRVARVMADNSKLKEKLAQLKPCSSEFFRLPVTNGVELDAWCIKPPGFDPAKRYPLLLHVYGEPAGTTVNDNWGGQNYLWHWMLAQRGYVVVSIDNRGTPAPRGRDWRKCIYGQVGILASADQAAATLKLLEKRPYLDPARVGIWGWSGGGSMTLNALLRYPEVYSTGMAIAFVSDLRLYDTIYQERYTGLPSQNAEGYQKGSPLTFAKQLKGNLLLVHGTADDNCHYQNCEVLINELIRHNRMFSLMSYPNRTHSIREGENTRRHLFETLTWYLENHLPVNCP